MRLTPPRARSRSGMWPRSCWTVWRGDDRRRTTDDRPPPRLRRLPAVRGRGAVGGPMVLLAVFSRAPRLKAAYATWAAASLFILVLSLARAFPITWNQTAAVGQIALSLLFVAGLLVFLR